MSEFDMAPKEISKRLSLDQKIAALGTDVGLTPRQANAITQARLQFSLSQLTEGLVDDVGVWLRDVATRSPSEAIRLYLELLEFRMPRMKAAQVVATLNAGSGGGKDIKDMTMEELNSIIAEQ